MKNIIFIIFSIFSFAEQKLLDYNLSAEELILVEQIKTFKEYQIIKADNEIAILEPVFGESQALVVDENKTVTIADSFIMTLLVPNIGATIDKKFIEIGSVYNGWRLRRIQDYKAIFVSIATGEQKIVGLKNNRLKVVVNEKN